ncbi:MAG TPA: C69 family dipeptidase, partial [Bacteroidales bacterium]|nr:C69 family dipeptidase [Bacteroidales bacterium]
MKKLIVLFLVIILAGMLPEQKTNACTNFLITKGASKDGSVMITYSADSHVLYGELYYWPAKNWSAGSMVDIYEWDTGKYMGRIPQAALT